MSEAKTVSGRYTYISQQWSDGGDWVELDGKLLHGRRLFSHLKNNQALIAKQSEQIKMLREAILAVVSKSEAFGVPSGVTVSMINCIKALEATKEQA